MLSSFNYKIYVCTLFVLLQLGCASLTNFIYPIKVPASFTNYKIEKINISKNKFDYRNPQNIVIQKLVSSENTIITFVARYQSAKEAQDMLIRKNALCKQNKISTSLTLPRIGEYTVSCDLKSAGFFQNKILLWANSQMSLSSTAWNNLLNSYSLLYPKNSYREVAFNFFYTDNLTFHSIRLHEDKKDMRNNSSGDSTHYLNNSYSVLKKNSIIKGFKLFSNKGTAFNFLYSLPSKIKESSLTLWKLRSVNKNYQVVITRPPITVYFVYDKIIYYISGYKDIPSAQKGVDSAYESVSF